MKLLILLSMALLVSCGKKPDSSKNDQLFISFQTGTQNFFVHTKNGNATELSEEEYFKLREKLRIFERLNNSCGSKTSDEFLKAVKELTIEGSTSCGHIPECEDIGDIGIVDLRCV